MAEHHASPYARGAMDIQAHRAAFHAFILMSKWGSLTVAVAVLFLVLCFCTGAGAVAALVSAAVLAALGFLILREKRTATA